LLKVAFNIEVMEDVEDRRERLKRLRDEAGTPAVRSNRAQERSSEPSRPMPDIKFRNYKPRDVNLAKERVRL
jgi:hypothetical protein